MFGQTDLCLDRQTHVQTDNLKEKYSDWENILDYPQFSIKMALKPLAGYEKSIGTLAI